jgi:hypothetical protein
MVGTFALLVLGINIQTWSSDGVRTGIITSVWTIFVGSVVYQILFRPKIVFFDEGITISNPIKELTFGWDQVDSIEARYSMSVVVQEKTIYAWAAPAPSRYHARNIHPSELRGLKIGIEGTLRPGESPRSDSGVAKHIAQMRMDNFVEKRLIGAESSIRYDFVGISITVVSLMLGIALNIIGF